MSKRPHKPFEPSDEQRNVVAMLVSVATPLEDICKVITNPDTGKPIARLTLEKAFPDEIKNGRSKVRAFVVGKLYKLIEQEHPASIFFYLKTQCGWRETHEVVGQGGGPLKAKLEVSFVSPAA